MKKLLTAVWFVFLAGCAASTFHGARHRANLVTNGMSVEEAIQVIGTPPTHQSETSLEWRRGTAQSYDATPAGAVRYHVQYGLIADVPPGGIFGQEARRRFIVEWAAQRDREQAQRQREQEEAARAAVKVAGDRAALAAMEAQKQRAQAAADAVRRNAEIDEERRAAAGARVPCNVKTSCAKVFALAQIYIATETDQKIQVVTDSVIQTYKPTEDGQVGASIIKMPLRGNSAQVSLSLTCRAGEVDAAGSDCRRRTTSLYKKFRPFVERQLVR